MSDVLDILLAADLPQPEQKQVKLKRLSRLWGKEVIFTLRELPYSRVAELRRVEEDTNVHIVLAGVMEPNLRAPDLLAKYDAITPAELVKKLLRPGEIEDLSRAIERLCGFREDTLEEVKKN